MKNLNSNNISLHSSSNYFLAFIFVILIPFAEWPDTVQHWTTRSFYVVFLDTLREFFQIKYPIFDEKEGAAFFSDKYFFYSEYFDNINILKLFFVIPIIFILNLISKKCLNQNMVFSPPFIFSLLCISLELFSIALITISYFFCISKKYIISIGLGFFATLIDRSSVPSFLAVIYLVLFLDFDQKKKYFNYIFLFFCVSILLLFINFFEDNILQFYNIKNEDIIYNKNFGEQKYLSLIASLSGLYGWLSLRPFPWFIYYSLILIFFVIGFFKIENLKKKMFLIFLFFAIITLYYLPSVGQARYFPVLTLLYWEFVLHGVKTIFKRCDFFIFFVLIMTILGLTLVKIL